VTSVVASFTCGHCGRTSYNPEDVRQRYCGACHRYAEPVTHMCPHDEARKMPCCGLTPFDVPLHDRLTLELDRVTCNG
jgi:hypothetical protein